MQLTASKPAVYASCVCRRARMLRTMHSGSRQLLIRSRDSVTLRGTVHATACQSVPFLYLVRPH